jgi:hypothetical protein
LIWIVWKKRNSRTFEDVSSSDNQLQECFVFTLFEWSKVSGYSSSSNVTGFISAISFLRL